MLDNVRQGLFPKEYRIPARPLTSELSAMQRAIAELRSLAGTLADAPAPVAVNQPENHGQERDLAQLCTSLWRSKKTMTGSASPEADETYRRPLRHLDSAIETVNSLGLEIIDHTGEALPETGAYSLRVVSFEPKEGLTRDVVLETLRPTVFLDGRCIQMGEIIVGTPVAPPSTEQAHD